MQFNSVHNKPALSKRAMLAIIPDAVKASLPAKNTLDYVDGKGVRRIRLHSTDILTFPKRGGFIIDTGGWNTHTTRARLNEFLPAGFSVYTNCGSIHLMMPRGNESDSVLMSVKFRQRVEVSASGKIRPDVTDKATARLVKQIDGFMAAWKKHGLPKAEESGGDPWILCDLARNGGKIEESTVLDWVKTRYVFRSFYAYALQYSGVGERQLGYYFYSADKRGLDATDYRRIRRYVRACLGLTV